MSQGWVVVYLHPVFAYLHVQGNPNTDRFYVFKRCLLMILNQHQGLVLAGKMTAAELEDLCYNPEINQAFDQIKRNWLW